MRDRTAAVADVQEGGLRQGGEQLVRRVRREDRRTFVILRFAVHCVSFAIERIEARVGIPRFVEVDGIDARVEQLLDAAGVIAQAVIGRVRDDRVYGALLCALGDQRIGANAVGDRGRAEPRGRGWGEGDCGVGPVMPGLVSMALWQLRSHSAVWSRAPAAMKMTRFDIEVPLVT